MTAVSRPRGDRPAVSVVVPVFDAAATLERALASVLAQTLPPLEIVIVDDASRDDSRRVMAAAAARDPRIRIFEQAANAGPARCRNLAMALCRGEWLALLDADDAWHPERLHRLLAGADGADMVFDGLAGVDPDTLEESGPLFPQMPRTMTLPALLEAQAPGSTYNFGYLKPLIRRAFPVQAGLAYRPELRTGEDLVFYAELLLAGARAKVVPEPLYLYTLPESAARKTASRYSHTRPKDREMSAALAVLAQTHASRMDEESRAAFERRLSYLAAIAPLAAFHDARLRGEWTTMVSLVLKERSVRAAIARKLASRLGAA